MSEEVSPRQTKSHVSKGEDTLTENKKRCVENVLERKNRKELKKTRRLIEVSPAGNYESFSCLLTFPLNLWWDGEENQEKIQSLALKRNSLIMHYEIAH